MTIKWYKFLKSQPGELKKLSLKDNEIIEKDNLVVCQKTKYLAFGKFNNYLDFVKFMIRETFPENRCFYEIIEGNKSQKPYFDIEFYVSEKLEEPAMIESELVLPIADADESIRQIVKAIQEELKAITSSVNTNSHIFVFTSHKDSKRSYHIVVEGFCFSDNKSNRLFSERIRSKIPEKWKNIIDASMYKSSQQFRIVGSCKFGTNRFKILNQELTVNGYGRNGWIPKIEIESEEHEILLLVEASLITQVSGSILLPSLLDDKEEASGNIKTKTFAQNELNEYFEPLTSENIKEALALCHKVAGMEYGDPRFPYGYMRTIEDNGESSIILL